MDSLDNYLDFINAEKVTTYDECLTNGLISNADIRAADDGPDGGTSVLHWLPVLKRNYNVRRLPMLYYYILTCYIPGNVNGRDIRGGTPMMIAANFNNPEALKVLIDFGGDRYFKNNENESTLDYAMRNKDNQEIVKMLTECFPSEM